MTEKKTVLRKEFMAALNRAMKEQDSFEDYMALLRGNVPKHVRDEKAQKDATYTKSKRNAVKSKIEAAFTKGASKMDASALYAALYDTSGGGKDINETLRIQGVMRHLIAELPILTAHLPKEPRQRTVDSPPCRQDTYSDAAEQRWREWKGDGPDV